MRIKDLSELNSNSKEEICEEIVAKTFQNWWKSSSTRYNKLDKQDKYKEKHN